MRIEVTGRQIDVGDALRSHVEEKITEAVSKYANRPIEAALTVSRDAHLFVCDCSAHLSTGLTAQSTARETEVYAACDAAIAKLEKQLRRYKRRLKDHHVKRKEPVAQVAAAAYVLDATYDEEAAQSGATPDDDAPATANGAEFWSPVVIAEATEGLPSLTVGEAVMQLELKHAPFLLFFNDGRRRINVVYRRDDGNIGWLDPVETGD
ncbi:MAG: ribosome-associated translation inhibitor RaiA [Pseudomonadota bacterium]